MSSVVLVICFAHWFGRPFRLEVERLSAGFTILKFALERAAFRIGVIIGAVRFPRAENCAAGRRDKATIIRCGHFRVIVETFLIEPDDSRRNESGF